MEKLKSSQKMNILKLDYRTKPGNSAKKLTKSQFISFFISYWGDINDKQNPRW
jgi:hypothetical protein